MIDFVGKTPFLRNALRVAMATMHFHKAKIHLFFRNFFVHFRWSQGSNLAPMRNCPGGAR